MPERWLCRSCGRPMPSGCICHGPRDPYTRGLLAIYTELRSNGIALEELVGAHPVDDLDELKRIDKAITVMKAGFKMVKKVLRKRGVDGRLKPEVKVKGPA